MSASGPTIRIVADDRERASGLPDERRKVAGVELTLCRLAAGDYLVEHNLIVERKSLRDWANSVIDGRWFKQTAALAAQPRRGVVILEGTVAQASEIGVSRDALQGALITASVFFGVAIVRAHDPSETARILVYLGRQSARRARAALPRPGYRPKGKYARQLFVLQGLPGVGPDRAKQLLKHFASVRRVANASAAELATIDEIGAATAAKIRWALD